MTCDRVTDLVLQMIVSLNYHYVTLLSLDATLINKGTSRPLPNHIDIIHIHIALLSFTLYSGEL